MHDLRSTTSRGEAEISINFAWGSDMDLALQRVQAALTGAQASLPPGVTFDVRRMDPTVFPVAAYSLTSARATPVALRRFADLTLAPLLSTIDGVARVQTPGRRAGRVPGRGRSGEAVGARPLRSPTSRTALAGANVLERRRPHRGPGQAATGAHRQSR